MILVIEDDEIVSGLICGLLTGMGHQTLLAETGAEAVELLNTEPVDLVISDIDLPDTSVLPVIEAMRNTPHLDDIPVLFCTGHADPETFAAARGLSPVGYMRKPLDPAALRLRVTGALERAPKRWDASGMTATRRTMLLALQDSLRSTTDQLQREVDPGGDRAVGLMMTRLRTAASMSGAQHLARIIDRLWVRGMTPQRRMEFVDALTYEAKGLARLLSATAPAAGLVRPTLRSLSPGGGR